MLNFIDLEKTPQNPTLGPITLDRGLRTNYELQIRDQCTEANKMVYRYASQNLDMQKIDTQKL